MEINLWLLSTCVHMCPHANTITTHLNSHIHTEIHAHRHASAPKRERENTVKVAYYIVMGRLLCCDPIDSVSR